VSSAQLITPELAQRLRERDITIHRVPPGADRVVPELLALLDLWRSQSGA
jgi:hypothetical protein